MNIRLPFRGTYEPSLVFGVYDPSSYANYPGKKHPGTDYPLPANTPLFAPMTGRVSVFKRTGRVGRGNEVIIRNGDFQVRSCHMNRLDVVEGEWVEQGTPIGLSGNTGYVLPEPTPTNPNAGAHLHQELLIQDQYHDFDKYVKEAHMPNGNPNEGDVHNIYLEFSGRKATPDEVKVYTNKSWSAGDGLYYGRALVEIRNLKKALKEAREATDPDILKLAESIKAIANK